MVTDLQFYNLEKKTEQDRVTLQRQISALRETSNERRREIYDKMNDKMIELANMVKESAELGQGLTKDIADLQHLKQTVNELMDVVQRTHDGKLKDLQQDVNDLKNRENRSVSIRREL